MLDVGAGVGALSLVLVRELPEIPVTAIDILPRAFGSRAPNSTILAVLDGASNCASGTVAELSELEAYDLIWLPARFLTEEALNAALLHMVDAIVRGDWLVVGTNPAPSGTLAAAVGRWNAVRNAGNSLDSGRMADALR